MAVLNERRRLETVRATFEGTEWRTAERINALQKRPPASQPVRASRRLDTGAPGEVK